MPCDLHLRRANRIDQIGARHKTPGSDGIFLEFYSANWEKVHIDILELLNQMFLHRNVNLRQKHAVLICLQKSDGENTPNGYRPISLLNTNYKLLSRILVRRLRHVMVEHLQHTQFFGVPGNSILDAASLGRDVIARAENTGTPLFILTLDFQNAFDRISHDYLFRILQRYGIRQCFIEGNVQ
jgi:hypothetical protein